MMVSRTVDAPLLDDADVSRVGFTTAMLEAGKAMVTCSNRGDPIEYSAAGVYTHTDRQRSHEQPPTVPFPTHEHSLVEPEIGYRPKYAQHSHADMVPKSSLPGTPWCVYESRVCVHESCHVS